GEATIEMHEDALEGIVAVGQKPKVAIIDDLLATGGTMEASCKLIKELGGDPALAAFVVELGFLNGQKVLVPYTKVESLAVIN
ncbi:MAG TPA: hypothetical protein V6C96_00485, partial [Vampirovibrionales bacterium]